MAGFTLLLLKISFLVVLWIFIIVVAVVVSSDMGARRGRKEKAARSKTPREEQSSGKKGKPEPWVLAIDSGRRAGDRLKLVPEVHIGRSPTCELVIDDDFVSGKHAILRHRSDGTWVLTDEGSTNGTFVNARKITTPTIVTVKDVMRIGDVQMRLEDE